MADALQLDVAGRQVRISSPDKVYFPQRGYTKRDVVEYYLAVGDGILRALHHRPTTLQRFPGRASTARCSSRSGSRARRTAVDRDRADHVSQRPAAPTSCARPTWPTWSGRRSWARSCSTRGRCGLPMSDHPDELRIDLDPQPGTDFADAVEAAPAASGRSSPSWAGPAGRRPPAAGACTSTCGSQPAVDVRAGAPGGDRVRPGGRAAPARPGHHRVVEGGARREGVRRLQPDGPGPHDRLRVLAAGQRRGPPSRRRSPGTS